MTKHCEGQDGSIPTRSTPWVSSWPGSEEEEERDALLGYLEERFGIPSDRFARYRLFQKGHAWWLLRNDPALCGVSGLKVLTAGLRAFSRVGRYIKPSTRMVQIFGRWATRGLVPLDERALARIAARRPLPLPSNARLTEGYLILTYEGRILGLGLLVNGLLHSQLPRDLLGPDMIPPSAADDTCGARR